MRPVSAVSSTPPNAVGASGVSAFDAVACRFRAASCACKRDGGSGASVPFVSASSMSLKAVLIMPGLCGVSGLRRNGAVSRWYEGVDDEVEVFFVCKDGRGISFVLLDKEELGVVLLLELATFRGVSFGSRLFFPLVLEIGDPPLTEADGGTSFASCLSSLGVETEYNRTPIAHWVDTLALERDWLDTGLLKDRNDDGDNNS